MRASASTAARICALEVLGKVFPFVMDTIDGSEIPHTTTGPPVGCIYKKPAEFGSFFPVADDAEIMLSFWASFERFFKNDDGIQSLEHHKTTKLPTSTDGNACRRDAHFLTVHCDKLMAS